MINTVVLVGRLTKDPELKYTQTGVAVARFTLAVNRPFSNQQGQNEADFISCVAWRKQAENMANFLRKGSLAGIEGRIQTSNFEGKDGNRVYMTEVVADRIQFLEPRSANQDRSSNSDFGTPPPVSGGAPQQQQQNQQPFYQNQQANQQNFTSTNADPFAQPKGQVDVSDDDLPF